MRVKGLECATFGAYHNPFILLKRVVPRVTCQTRLEKTLKLNLTILTSMGIKNSLFRYHTYDVTSIQRVLKNI
jgi:hypothetical protein